MFKNLEDILDNDKEYEDYAEKSAPHYADLDKGLEIVREFIRTKKLVLYGGIAIDYALKTSGHVGIYKPDVIPDYDFASSDAFADSIELADILHKSQLPNVASINAVHVTTRRVSVQFEFVADITYYPPNVFKMVPYLEYNKLRYVHPHFQRMDFHREYCFPLDGPPYEVLKHRTRKTMKRFALIRETHPLKFTGKMSSIPTVDMSIPLSQIRGATVNGVAAYALMHKLVSDLFMNSSKYSKVLGVIPADLKKRFEATWDPKTTFTKSAMVLGNVPKTLAQLCMYTFTEDLSDLPGKVSKAKLTHYNPFLDYLRPPMYYDDSGSFDVEIYDCSRKLLPCFDAQSSFNLIGGVGAKIGTALKGTRLPLVHATLLYFLFKWHHGERKDNAPLAMYVSLYDLLEIAEGIFKHVYSKKDAKLTDAMNAEVYPKLPFFLTHETCGTNNFKEEYEIHKQRNLDIINKVPFDKQEVNRPPHSYYPETYDKPAKPAFDPAVSRFFSIDGMSKPKTN